MIELLLTISSVGMLVSILSRRRSPKFWVASVLLGLVSGMRASVLALVSNGQHFFMAWELFTLSAYFLITLNGQQATVRTAGWAYPGGFAWGSAGGTHWELGPQHSVVGSDGATLATRARAVVYFMHSHRPRGAQCFRGA